MAGDEHSLTAVDPFVTDGGIETDLMFRRGLDLPHFCLLYTSPSPRDS